VLDSRIRTGAGVLPSRRLVLTFDDGPGLTTGAGPGPRTRELGQYLAEERIPATFFMCGKHIAEQPDMPAELMALGHHIGNHTWSHRSLLSLDSESIQREVLSTRQLLTECGVGGPIAFRPPFGEWDSRVSAAMRANEQIRVGHDAVFLWNVNADDWRSWDHGAAPDDCARSYESAALAADSGIVLMHDSLADDGPHAARRRAANRTLEAVMLLVPRLRAQGFTFIPLSQVERQSPRQRALQGIRSIEARVRASADRVWR